VCGYRQFLLGHAKIDHGWDHLFMVLHADEIWTVDPRPMARKSNHDGFIYNLPFFFPRQGEDWLEDVHPLDQLHWHLGPGWPEFRLFKGNPTVAYDPVQRFNTKPSGIRSVTTVADPILHYPYRAPAVQRLRAATHERTQFDPDNYQHILNEDAVYWDDDRIRAAQARPEFTTLASSL
jgi:hypothetical protein